MKTTLRHECHLFVTNKCNQECFHCSYAWLMNRIQGKLDIKKLDKINFNKFELITITGGEPGLLSKDIKLELINYLKHFNKRIQIFTNGTHILDWPDEISKLVHIIDFNNIIEAENVSYMIPLTSKTNIEDLKKGIDKLRQIQKIDGYVHIKNDCISPLSKDKLNSIMKYIGLDFSDENPIVKKSNKLKLELSSRCIQLDALNGDIIHSRINLSKQCCCTFYNCLS